LEAPAGDAASSPAEIANYPSVELFVRRAQEADPGFQLDETNAADVAQICVQLEGLPLAVELAAARVKILKPAQMLKKFGQKFQFLKSTRRDLSDRQRTLEGAIQWSYDHLEEWERRAFLQVAAFAGGFFLEAAEAVIDLEAFPEAPPAIDVVQSLREQCLLRTVDERYELRLGMYQSIREFGEQKRRSVFTPEEEAALQERLAEYLIGYCETWAGAIHTRHGLEAVDRVALETENLFAVQDWFQQRGRIDLAGRAILALAEAMSIRGPADQRRPRLERAAQGAPAGLRAPLLTQLSLACHATGDWDLAAQYADQAVAELHPDEEPRPEMPSHAARALRQQGIMRRLRGDMDGALEAFRQSEEAARRADDRHGLAAAIAQRGFLVWQCGEFDEALQCYAEAEAIAAELGDQADVAMIVRQRGQLRAQRGEYQEALDDFEQTETLAKELGDRRLLHLTISARGAIYSDQGRYDEALECFERAERLARQLGEKRGVAVNRGNRGLVYADRGDYEKALGYYADAESLNRTLGVTAGIALNISNRGVALAGLGRWDDALACLDEAEQLHHKLGSRLQEAITRGERGAVLLAQGKLDEARSALTDALATFDDLSAGHTPDCFNFLTSLAAIHAHAGNVDAARHAAARAQSLAELLGLTSSHPRLRIRESLEILAELKSKLG
jgi:tetratricopeptide (TPR) repeat protein